jgi:glycosyltransferase involved in cell wall biosynthesis
MSESLTPLAASETNSIEISEKSNAVSQQAPRTLHIVLNGVHEDSRVLKCAWSLGNAGWDVLVAGSSPSGEPNQLAIGYARIERLPLKIVISRSQVPIIFRPFIRGERTRWFIEGSLRHLRRYRRKLFELLGIKREVVVPNLARAAKAITPVAMEFEPAIIHAHDYTALPIAGAVIQALRDAGKSVELVYDAHEYVPGVAHLTKPMANLYTKIERKYSAGAAAVLSVSEPMSDLLMDQLAITVRPTIVANDPLVEGQEPSKRKLRDDCGIDAKTPLLVYSGAVAPQRGVQTALVALRQLPDVHLALIANPANKSVQDLVASAPDLADRFHVLAYVPNSELVSYLSQADVGLIPILHRLNHEISLITKFGEYMQARLPILVSDVKTMSAEVRKLGNGEVHLAEDVDDFVRAAKLILAAPEMYRTAYTPEVLAEHTWEGQAEILVNLYNTIASVKPSPRAYKPFLVEEISKNTR